MFCRLQGDREGHCIGAPTHQSRGHAFHHTKLAMGCWLCVPGNVAWTSYSSRHRGASQMSEGVAVKPLHLADGTHDSGSLKSSGGCGPGASESTSKVTA